MLPLQHIVSGIPQYFWQTNQTNMFPNTSSVTSEPLGPPSLREVKLNRGSESEQETNKCGGSGARRAVEGSAAAQVMEKISMM
ncbi:protein enabled-like protein [Platysternon megacephalum]|uniref:Protein enabled-like protein n=1 Tax=Platysternon megacephalum TaxID=55544 RepID=A0A4D9EWJ3_9SAUR|nr:protein enabled-like protein [Platysternon megacephalum]